MDVFASFNDELNVYANSVLSLNRMVLFFRSKLDENFSAIKAGGGFDSSVDSLDSMFRIQRALAVAKYKHSFEFDDFILDFIYKFDRDDLPSRQYIYEIIKGSSSIESAVSNMEV